MSTIQNNLSSPLLSFRLDPFLPAAFVSPSYVPFCPGVSCNPGPILPLCLPSDFFVRSSRFQSRRVRHHLFCALSSLCSLFIHLLQVVHHPVVSIRTEFKPGNASLATLYRRRTMEYVILVHQQWLFGNNITTRRNPGLTLRCGIKYI